MTKPITWIASYPKSGNTWLRFMACNLLLGRQESAAALDAFIPDVHDAQASGSQPNAEIMKTHFPLSPALPGFDRTGAAIYVVRHPADVLVSNFFYAQRSTPNFDASQRAFDGYVERFLECRGDPRWSELGMGSWEENVRSWRDGRAAFPVLILRYEDMAADPATACRALADVLRPGVSASEIEAAVENSSFRRMREIERADIRQRRVGIFYKPYLQASIDAGSRFMRRGVVGDGAARLSTSQASRLHAVFGTLLGELGYESP